MMALSVGTPLFMNRSKWRYAFATAIPMIFMIAVTALPEVWPVNESWTKDMRFDTIFGVFLLSVSSVLAQTTFSESFGIRCLTGRAFYPWKPSIER